MRRLILLLCATALLSCSDRPDERAAPIDRPRSATGGDGAQTDERCTKEWQEVDDGVRYRTAGCRDGGDRFELHLVEIDPKRWIIDVIGGARRPMRDAVAATRARFAINANFFDVHDRALGVVVSSGRPVQRVHPVSWQSIFSITDGGDARITSRAEWERNTPEAFAAAQAGPRLVIRGEKNQVAKAEPSLRSGVCITAGGAVRFFVTPPGSYADVHEMVDLASRSESDDGMGCHDAMLFDGGPSAQMYLAARDKKIDTAGDVVPVFVVARPRE